MLKSIDEKIDDGLHWNGRMRTHCYGSKNAGFNTYDDAVNNNKKCSTINYAM